jgi:hypothetical protein
MKNFTNITRIAALAAMAAIGFSLGACEKKEKAGKPTEEAVQQETQKPEETETAEAEQDYYSEAAIAARELAEMQAAEKAAEAALEAALAKLDANPPADIKPEAYQAFDGIPFVFGFADESGTRLLSYRVGTDPAMFTLAIGPYGEKVKIKFAGWQKRNEEEDNGRDTYHNFDNLDGYVYRSIGGKLKLNTYYLTNETIIKDLLIPLSPTKDTVSWEYPKIDAKTVKHIESIKNRKVKWTKQLAVTKDGAQIGQVLFQRVGDEMLYSIVYIENEKILFMDYPATYDEISTWRVDDNGEPGTESVLFLARTREGALFLVTEDYGAEGINTNLLYEKDGSFIKHEEVSYYRYTSPM